MVILVVVCSLDDDIDDGMWFGVDIRYCWRIIHYSTPCTYSNYLLREDYYPQKNNLMVTIWGLLIRRFFFRDPPHVSQSQLTHTQNQLKVTIYQMVGRRNPDSTFYRAPEYPPISRDHLSKCLIIIILDIDLYYMYNIYFTCYIRTGS